MRTKQSLEFSSPAMAVQGVVVRVQINVSPTRGTQSASSPVVNGNTPVFVTRAQSAAASDFPHWMATSGQAVVSDLQLGSDFGLYPFIYGTASGTVDASLASSDGNRIRLTGTWACVVEIDRTS